MTPRDKIEPIRAARRRISDSFSRNNDFFVKKNPITHTHDSIWDSTVASAEPATPISHA